MSENEMVMVAAIRECPAKIERSAFVSVRAWLDAGSIARVMNVFTQRNIVPAFVSCRRSPTYILIDVQLDPADGVVDPRLLERLRALACVDRAEYAATT